MLELVLGKDWTANTQYVLNGIAKDVSEEQGGRILLVPELISHDMERRLCAAAGDTASRYAEVLTFTRLVRRVSEEVRRPPEECMDNGGRMVVMAAAARRLHSQLKVYAALETKPEFFAQLLDAVDEFKRCCITPEELRNAAKRSEGVLAQKLEELSLLLETYDALCQRGKRDPRDQMNWVLEQLEECDFAANNVFYIDGFPDLTRQHMAILEHFIRYSPKVTVSLNCNIPSSKVLAYEKAGETAAALIRYAKRVGVEVKIISVDQASCPLTPVREYIFQGHILPTPDIEKHLTVRKAESIYQECQAVAEDIRHLIRCGCRYRNISVVCTDMASYRPVIGMVMRRYGIPIYLSGTDDVVGKGAMITMLSALDAALDGFEQKSIFRYLRSPLSPISQKKCDLVENYAFIWGISGKGWLEPWTAHPDGLSDVWTQWTKSRLEALEQTRVLIMEPLSRLRKGMKNSQCLADQVMVLYTFLEDISFAKRLGKLADELEKAGDLRGAQIQNQLWEILVKALEQMHDVLGETYWEEDAFRRLLVLMLSQYDVGTIPTVLDSVTIGPVSAMRCQQEDHLFVLGANEGALPGYSGSAGVLTDQERTALRSMDVQLTGGALEGIQAEFAEVYGVFCGAQDTITVSCPTAQPSYVYRRLADLAGREEQIRGLTGYAEAEPVSAAACLLSYHAFEEAKELGLQEAYERVKNQRDHSLGAVSYENIQQLYGSSLKLSASQVDRQAECRLSYFLRYGIKAKERKEATVDPAEYGTYVHDVLENTAREVMARGGFHKVSLEDTMQLAKEFSDAYTQQRFSELESRRLGYLFQRNVQELGLVVEELWKELSTGAYIPTDFELGFGEGEEMPEIRIDTPRMNAELRGFVDRVDRFSVENANYFRVVDYKTGKKDFDYCDVFNGVGLQMLLYLFALEQEGQEKVGVKPIPAGVQYFPARVPYVSLDGAREDDTAEREKLWRRKGLLLADELSLTAMDPDEEMPRLCCSRRKDGTLSGDLATRDQMKQLRQYVFSLLRNMVDEIASGVVEPNPYTRGTSHSACAFCPYDSVCHKDSVTERRNYKTMSAQRFWEEIEKVVGSRG